MEPRSDATSGDAASSAEGSHRPDFKKIVAHVQQGMAYLKIGDEKTTESEFQRAIIINPRIAAMEFTKAIVASFEANQVHSAAAKIELATLFCYRGRSLYAEACQAKDKNCFKEAYGDLTMSLEQNSLCPEAWFYKGCILMRLQQHHNVIAERDNKKGIYSLADPAVDYSEAIDCFHECLKLIRNMDFSVGTKKYFLVSEVYFYLSQAYKRADKRQLVNECLARILEVCPKDALFYNDIVPTNRAKWRSALADITGAKVEYQPNAMIDFYIKRAQQQVIDGWLDTAIADCMKALTLKPRNVSALCMMGSLLALEGKWDDALVRLDNAVNEDSNREHRSLPLRASVYLAQGNILAAQKDLKEIFSTPAVESLYKIYSAAQLVKTYQKSMAMDASVDYNNDIVNLTKFLHQNIDVLIASKEHTAPSEWFCIVVFACSVLNAFDKARKFSLQFRDQRGLSGVAAYLRTDFFKSIMQPWCWPQSKDEKYKISASLLSSIRRSTVALIMVRECEGAALTMLKANLALQALCRCTYIGDIFEHKGISGDVYSNLYDQPTSPELLAMVKNLNQHIMDIDPFVVDEATQQALSIEIKKNPHFLAAIKKEYSNIYTVLQLCGFDLVEQPLQQESQVVNVSQSGATIAAAAAAAVDANPVINRWAGLVGVAVSAAALFSPTVPGRRLSPDHPSIQGDTYDNGFSRF